MTSVEPRKPKIDFITRGGVATREDQNTHHGQLHVQPAAQKKAPLDVQKEKEVFLDVQPEFVDANKPSTYGQVKTIPERFENLMRKKPMKKVSKLK